MTEKFIFPKIMKKFSKNQNFQKWKFRENLKEFAIADNFQKFKFCKILKKNLINCKILNTFLKN